MRFADTNILLYAISTTPEEQPKAQVALQLLDAGDLGLSVQVLQEFYVQSTRSKRSGRLSHEQAVRLIESFLRFPIQEISVGVLAAALDAKQRFRISYWDAAIVEAARAQGCHTVLSEDLNHGQDYDGVRVENPFDALS